MNEEQRADGGCFCHGAGPRVSNMFRNCWSEASKDHFRTSRVEFWKGLRSEIPWVSDPPGSIVRDRVRLTLQPFDAPPDPASVMRLIEHIGSDEMLLFSTDYPHYQFEEDHPIPEGLDKGIAQKIMAENPLRTYVRLNERETTA